MKKRTLLLGLLFSFLAQAENFKALLRACQNSDLKMVSKILDRDKELSVTSSSGVLEKSPLELALVKNDQKLFRLLLSKRPQAELFELTTPRFASPLEVAISSNNREAIKLIFKLHPEKSPLDQPRHLGFSYLESALNSHSMGLLDLKTLETLLDVRPGMELVEPRAPGKNSILKFIIMKKDNAALKMFLKKYPGLKLKSPDANSRSIYDYAQEAGDKETVETLENYLESH